MACRDVRGFSGECDLNGGWTPRYKVCELSFTDPEQGLVDLKWRVMSKREATLPRQGPYIGRIDISLDNVQNTNVAGCLGQGGGNHSVLGL